MRNTFAMCFTFFVSLLSFAQQGEFEKYRNGLIYSNKVIRKIQRVTDSLNLEPKTYTDKVFYSKEYGAITTINLKGDSADEAYNDLQAGMTCENLLAKYQDADVVHDLLFALYNYETIKGEDMVGINFMGFDDYYESDYHKEEEDFRIKGFNYRYYKKTQYSEADLDIYCMPDELISKPLPEKYSRLVQYSQGLLDTVKVSFKGASKECYCMLEFPDTEVYSGYKNTEKIGDFNEYIDEKTNKPQHYKAIEKWEKKRFRLIAKILKKDKVAREMFNQALEAGLKREEISDDDFDEYVAYFDSAENALFLKRCRIIVGEKRNDPSPRNYELKIAQLAGQAGNRAIFLRAHLNLMNDYFNRYRDNSTAWDRRKTYIKELEALNINVPDLLLGICLRVGNPLKNHYYGDTMRVGRAIAESENKEIFEQAMLDMIKDNQLDDYNRVIMFFVFCNYNSYTVDVARQKVNTKRLKEAVATLPDYIKNKIKIE